MLVQTDHTQTVRRAFDLFEANVVAAGRISEPGNVLMRWTFEFEGDLISRITPSEERWAPLNGREFTIAQVAGAPAGGEVVVRIAYGRSLSLPVDSALAPFATPSSPVLVFFEQGEPAGWYLPDAQRGMVLP